jgi:hypothetical protein
MTIFVNPDLRQKISAAAESRALARYCLWFCSMLYIKSTERADGSTVQNEFHPLGSKALRKVVTTKFYGRMLRLLREINAVEVKGQSAECLRGSYISAGLAAELDVEPKSKQYRLRKQFRTGAEAVQEDWPSLESRIEKHSRRATYATMKRREHRWIVRSYQSVSFAPDAAQILSNHPFKTDDARHRASNHLENVAAHRLHFRRCPKSGRIYYSIANLPKVLRRQIRLDGKKTLELDLAASQPTLLATLYPDGCDERKAYLADVQSGRFYERFAEDARESWDRDRAKTEFFNQIAYGSYYSRKKYKLLPAFKRRYPILESIMAANKKGGNDKLPILMQTKEAAIVIGGACAECAQRNIKVLPVHDSIIVKRSDAAAARKILSRHWFDQTGITAQIKSATN